jgi:hypothetical protein
MGAVLAALDMAAEGRRAAALDRCHHLQLVAAHVTGIGLAPCRSVIAEDIRNLQCRTGQDRRPLCRWLVRLILPALLGLLVLLRQQVERALDRRDDAGGDMRIPRRRLRFGVSQQRLQGTKMGAALEQVGGKAVPQPVQGHALLNSRRLRRLMKQPVQLACADRSF